MSNSSSLKVIIWELVRSGGVCVCTSPRFNLTLQHVYIYILFTYMIYIYMYIFVFFISGSFKEHSVCCVLLISSFKNESVKRQLSNKNVPMVVGNTKVARKSQRSQCLKRHFRLVVGLVIVTPPKFNSSPLKLDGWKTMFLFGVVTSQGRAVKLQVGIVF